MLVFCFGGHTFVVYLQTTKVHNNSIFKELTLLSLSTPEILPVKSPHAFGFPIVNTPPFLRNSSSKNPPPPSPSEISPKSRPWYRYGYFLESPICIVLNRPVSSQSSPKFHTNHSNSEIASPKSIQSL